MFKKLITFIFISVLSATTAFATTPEYNIVIKDKSTVHVKANFTLANDTIFIFMRGGTAQLPEAEAAFVKNLVVTSGKDGIVSTKYVGEGNWILNNVKPGQDVAIEYDLLTTHNQYNWDHIGGLDEIGFVGSDGLFFTGYALFIVPEMEMQNITVDFQMPDGWKASTPWVKKKENIFYVENTRLLLNNCFMLGKHQEGSFTVNGMEMRVAISNKLAYAKPLFQGAMEKLIPAYQKLFGGTPASNYLVAINEHAVNDGSAFRRSFSLISSQEITAKGLPTWGYLVAHEILHLWNGLAIVFADRGDEWFKEGVTDYLSIMMMRKVNLLNDDQVNRKLEAIARRYWLDRYWQKDTLSIQQTGYEKEKFRYGVYGGGAIIGFALDVEMRKVTNNKKGVTDLMQQMFNEFGKTKKAYHTKDIIRIVNEITGKDLNDFFNRYLIGKEILDIEPYLKACGLDYNTAIEEVYISKNEKATAAQRQLYESIFLK